MAKSSKLERGNHEPEFPPIIFFLVEVRSASLIHMQQNLWVGEEAPVPRSNWMSATNKCLSLRCFPAVCFQR